MRMLRNMNNVKKKFPWWGWLLIIFLLILIFIAIFIILIIKIANIYQVEQNSSNFEFQFYLADTNKFIDGEVLIYDKSLGMTKNGSLIVPKNELINIENIFFKTSYNDKTIILPYAFYKEDLEKKGVAYTTNEKELASNTFNISEKDILN